MGYKFRVSPNAQAFAIFQASSAADDGPLTAPLSFLDRIMIHSSLRYPGVVATLTGTLNLASCLTGSANTIQNTHVLGAHGQSGKPMLFGRFTGLGIPWVGSVPVQQYVDGTHGPTSNVRWLTLGADGNNVLAYEMARGSVAVEFLPAISIAWEVRILDRNLDAALPNSGPTIYRENAGSIEFVSPKGTFSSAKRYLRLGGGGFRLAGGKTTAVRFNGTIGGSVYNQTTFKWDDGVSSVACENVFTGNPPPNNLISRPPTAFTPRGEGVIL